MITSHSCPPASTYMLRYRFLPWYTRRKNESYSPAPHHSFRREWWERKGADVITWCELQISIQSYKHCRGQRGGPVGCPFEITWCSYDFHSGRDARNRWTTAWWWNVAGTSTKLHKGLTGKTPVILDLSSHGALFLKVIAKHRRGLCGSRSPPARPQEHSQNHHFPSRGGVWTLLQKQRNGSRRSNRVHTTGLSPRTIFTRRAANAQGQTLAPKYPPEPRELEGNLHASI